MRYSPAIGAVQTGGHAIARPKPDFFKKSPLKPTKTVKKATEGLYLEDFYLHIPGVTM
jgi:hypothetical protein